MTAEKAKMVRLLISGLLVWCALARPAPAAEDFPDVLQQALREAKTAEAYDFSYTIDVKTPEADIGASFDPRRQPNERWSLLYPSGPQADGKGVRRAFRSLLDLKTPASLLTLDDLAGNFSKVALVGESDNRIEYAFQPVPVAADGKLGPLIEPHLDGRVVVQKSPPRLLQITLTSKQPFAITPLARVNRLEQIIDIRYVPEIGAVVADRVATRVDGNPLVSAFFHSETLAVQGIAAFPKSPQPQK